jgi:uncharacterized RDD family membrane protein YckC
MLKCAACGLVNPDGAASCDCGYPLSTGEPSPISSAAADTRCRGSISSQFADPWRRLGAVTFDGVLLLFVRFVVASAVSTESAAAKTSSTAAGLVIMVVPWFYMAGLESSRWQASLGKRLFGMRVGNLRDERISFWHASARFWARTLSALTLFVGFVMILWTKKRQCLHDMVAGTLVLRGRA